MDLNPSSSKDLVAETVKCLTPEMDSFTYNLPDTFIKMVFDHLPLEDLLHCNLVCHQWNGFYRAACARRRVLTLIITNQSLEETVSDAPFNSHPFANWDDKLSPIRHSWIMRKRRTFDHRLVTGLMHNLANITSLEIILNDVQTAALGHVVELLHFWAGKLSSLKLDLYFEFAVDGRSLLDAINSLSNLTHLTLIHKDHHRDVPIYEKNSQNEPILLLRLEHLQEFNHAFKYIYTDDDMCKAIYQYAKSHPNLRSIGLAQTIMGTEQMDSLLSCGPQVASRITQLYLTLQYNHNYEYERVIEAQLTRLCGHFCQLTRLELPYPNLPVRQWTKTLAQCHALNYLKFTGPISGIRGSSKENIRKQITQLSSIKRLSLELEIFFHTQLEFLHLPWIYPNLEMIQINDRRFGCFICGLSEHQPHSEREINRNAHCRRRMLGPLFKEMEQLSLVKYNQKDNGNVFYSKDDLCSSVEDIL